MAGHYTPLALVFGDVLTEDRAATLETQYKLAKERARPLGGIYNVGVDDDDWVDVPGVIEVLIDEDTTAQVHAMGSVVDLSPAVTGSLRLWDQTASAEVASSPITFTETTATLQMTPDLELLAGHRYRLQVKISDSAGHVLVYGASLVTQ